MAPLDLEAFRASGNFLVKLVDVISGRTVVTVFVRGGSRVHVDIPAGTYDLRYATGENWYGYEHLFGPATSYYKAQARLEFIRTAYEVRGHEVTLYRVLNGNLRTSNISPEEF